MELIIVNPDANNFCEGLGISPERQQELSKALDAMVRRLDSGPAQLYKLHNVFAEILSFCHNEAESVYCTILHCGLNARRGRILAPGPLNKERVQLGFEQLYDRLRRDHTRESQVILRKIMLSNLEDPSAKDIAREGVQRLLDLKDLPMANDIIDKMTGFAF